MQRSTARSSFSAFHYMQVPRPSAVSHILAASLACHIWHVDDFQTRHSDRTTYGENAEPASRNVTDSESLLSTSETSQNTTRITIACELVAGRCLSGKGYYYDSYRAAVYSCYATPLLGSHVMYWVCTSVCLSVVRLFRIESEAQNWPEDCPCHV